MLADAENVNVIYEVLRRLGFQKFVVNINDRKVLTGIGQFSGVPDELLGGLYRSIDKLEKIGLDGVRNELRRNEIPDDVVEKMLDLLQIEGENEEVLAALRSRLGEYPVAMEGITELEEVIRSLKALNIPQEFYKVRFAMVRGLEYYTGPIYETTIEEPKMPSITGGGRYDQLIGLFSDTSFPATGTTIGIERIIDAMEELKMFPAEVGRTVVQVLVTLFDTNLTQASLQIANTLRAGGLRTEMYFEPDSLGAQLRYAGKKGIPFVVIPGPDEVAAGQVTIRNLETKEQQAVDSGDAVAYIKQRL
jgi:histidyl-tRNA synthetase